MTTTPDNKTDANDKPAIDQSVSDTPEKQITTSEQSINNPAIDEHAEVPIWMNISIYLSTIFFPLVGIVLGFTYFRKDDPEKKRAGRNWLILGVAVLIIHVIMVSAMKRPEAGL